jgi:predicted porin
MQKKLLTLAVAGALAVPGLALAQVEVYGTVNMSFGNVKYDSVSPNAALPAGAPSVTKWDVANHASNYGIRGRESLGAGLTAWFQIEQNAPLERSNNNAITPASRNSAVGLQGGWGNLFIGQWTTPWADLDALWSVGTVGGWGPVTSIIGRRETTGGAPSLNCGPNVHGDANACDAVESTGGVGHPLWRRVSQAIFYQSPVFGGFQAKFAYQTNEAKSVAGIPRSGQATPSPATQDPKLWSGSVQWAGMGGRLRIGAAYDIHEDFSFPGKDDEGWRVTGGWNFGFADIGLAYETFDYGLSATVDCKAEQYGIALAVPIGQGAIRASYAEAQELEGPGCAGLIGAANTPGGGGAKTWNIGYDHRFSKRTTVGFGYATIENEGVAAFAWTGLPPNQSGGGGLNNGPLPGGTVSTFFVNTVHRF